MFEITLGRFSSSPVLAMGRSLGLFEAAGVSVNEAVVGSSREQFADLGQGRYSVVLTSPDNVLRHAPEGIRLLRGVDLGLGLSLLARAPITEVTELRGKRLGVDAPDSGFALVLYEILCRFGLEIEDVEIVELGTTPARSKALLAGECDATMLNAGHDLVAEAAGANRLVRASSVTGPYLGSVLATLAAPETDAEVGMDRFLGAWDESVLATLEPSNRSAVIAEIQAGLASSAETAERYYATILDPEQGYLLPMPAHGPAFEGVRRIRSAYAADHQ